MERNVECSGILEGPAVLKAVLLQFQRVQCGMLVLPKAPLVGIGKERYPFGPEYDPVIACAYLLMRDKQAIIYKLFIETAIGKGAVLPEINGIYSP